MASPSTSSVTAPAAPPKYEYLRSLSDIQSVRDLTSDGIRDIMRNHTSDHGLEIAEMGEISDMSGLNDAFNSTICSLRVKVQFSGKGRADGNDDDGDDDGDDGAAGNQEREYNFVIKSTPKMTFVRMVHKFSRPFFNEVSWYLDLVPQLELLHGKGSLSHLLPTCYHAYSSYYAGGEGQGSCCTNSCPWFCWLPCKRSEQGVLILENVKRRSERSYAMYDKRKPLPLAHMLLTMRELAHFHGKWLQWTYACRRSELKEQDGTTPLGWKEFQGTYNTQKRIPLLLYKQLKNVARKSVVKVLKNIGPEEDENIEKCKRFFDRSSMPLLSEYLRKPAGPIHTLCHGDFWSNNILFSYDEDDKDDEGQPKVRDLIFIDFQLINYGHPAYDLVYFIYLNTDLSFRDAHLQTVLSTYYEHFAPYVREACPDLDYSLTDFVSDFNYHRPIGFTTACSVMPNVMSETQLDLEANGLSALRELQRKQEAELADENNPASREIRRRLVDMVHEMARDGVI